MNSFLPYDAIFNGFPAGAFLLSPTPDAIILAVNDAFLNDTGCIRHELIGISMFIAFPGDSNELAEPGGVALRRSIDRVITTGQSDILPALNFPIRRILPSGEVRYEDRFCNARSTPIFGENEQIVCILHSTTDVTALIQADGARNESERRFRALVRASAEVVYRMGPDWREMHQLEGRGFLENTSDARSLWIDAYIPDEDHELVHRAIEHAIQCKTMFELEHRVRRADGTYGWTFSRAIPMLDAHGNIYEWIGAASDITHRKQEQEQSVESARHKDEFLAMLAHELRNPLAPISSAAQLLETVTLDEKLVQRSSQIISRQIRHMTGLIDDLLDVSRVSRGLVELVNVPLVIQDIVDKAVEQATPLVDSLKQSLGLHLSSDHDMVMGDEKRLVQVFANILNNAAKYTPKGGNISLEIDVRDLQIVVEVLDDGIGMEPELASRVFDLFTQGRRNSDRSSGGLGLGLALVKSLVALHQGSVTCVSAGTGKGSKFTVCLPWLFKDRRRTRKESSAEVSADKNNALRVMVVDDNVDAAATLGMLLEVLGHEVIIENAPMDALEHCRHEVPEVFLLDIGLPQMDGNELARRLRAQVETADAVLIAVTGYGRKDDRIATAVAGFDYHLVKPVDMEVLIGIFDEIGAAKFPVKPATFSSLQRRLSDRVH